MLIAFIFPNWLLLIIKGQASLASRLLEIDKYLAHQQYNNENRWRVNSIGSGLVRALHSIP